MRTWLQIDDELEATELEIKAIDEEFKRRCAKIKCKETKAFALAARAGQMDLIKKRHKLHVEKREDFAKVRTCEECKATKRGVFIAQVEKKTVTMCRDCGLGRGKNKLGKIKVKPPRPVPSEEQA